MFCGDTSDSHSVDLDLMFSLETDLVDPLCLALFDVFLDRAQRLNSSSKIFEVSHLSHWSHCKKQLGK